MTDDNRNSVDEASTAPSPDVEATASAEQEVENSIHAELDLDWVREQFPAFSDPKLSGWAHLENAGGSYAARQVRDIFSDFYVTSKVQPYYAGDPSRRAGEAMDRAKALIPATLNADPGEVMFGPSTTMNTYILSHAIREQLDDGDEIIVTNQDHEANIGAWRRLEGSVRRTV